MKKIMITIITAIVILSSVSPSSSALTVDDLQYEVVLQDESGAKIDDGYMNTKVMFDTSTDSISTKYYLRTATTLTIPPTNLYIQSDSGTFNSFVTITGLKSYLADSGIRMTITNGDQHYSADLTKENKYTSYFNNADAYAVLDCNKPYSISMTTLGAVETTVPPEDINDITFTFTVHMAKGNHQVMFISQDDVVEAYKVMDGYVIDKLPSISRTGYDLVGWFLPDGREVTEGFVITENDADIIATAEWKENDALTFGLPVVGIIIGELLVGMFIFFLIKKRRGNSGE